jgi:hypothetical protein
MFVPEENNTVCTFIVAVKKSNGENVISYLKKIVCMYSASSYLLLQIIN